MHRSWLRKTRGGPLYFCLACFRYVATISEPGTGKRFSENKHTLHWHKAKICKSVKKNFHLSFIQSLIDMTQMFNMIYRWPSFGGPQNTLGLRISWETSAIFSPVPECSLLPRCPREVWEKAGERVSLADVTSHERSALVNIRRKALLSSVGFRKRMTSRSPRSSICDSSALSVSDLFDFWWEFLSHFLDHSWIDSSQFKQEDATASV